MSLIRCMKGYGQAQCHEVTTLRGRLGIAGVEMRQSSLMLFSHLVSEAVYSRPFEARVLCGNASWCGAVN